MHLERVPLVGREAELDELRALLRAHSPVTVVGVGGVGKTRLAAAAADDGGRGAAPAVCDLAGTTDAAQVGDAVAEALGFPSLDAAAVGLSGTRVLLVLDNCEHVLDAVAAVVERLARDCPLTTVLATSREPLDVVGEHVLALETLALPAGGDRSDVEQSPAGQLFLDRAAAAGSPPPGEDDWAAIAQLCRCLDGLPLAIELAAARTRSLTPAEISSHLGDRLDLLARRRDRGPARHRSLEAAIGWSYDRLPSETQRLFDRLGVFASRFSAQAARAVAGAPDDDLLGITEHLDQLVTQSLVTVEQHAGRSWYGMLDTIRAFARTRLAERGELAAVQDLWVDSLLDAAVDLVSTGMRKGSLDAWVTVHTLQGDLLAALRWCLDHDAGPERAVRLFLPLWWVAYNARAEPVAELGARVLSCWPDPAQPGWADVAAITAFAHVVLGGLERGEALAAEALAAPHTTSAAVIARRALTAAAHAGSRDEEALRSVEKAITEAAGGGLPAWQHELEAVHAFLLGGVGRTDEAIVQATAARDGAAALGSPTLLAWATLAHGCLVALREPAAGRSALKPLAERCWAAGDGLGAGRTLRALGAIAVLEGDVAAAVAALRDALEIFTRIGHASQIRSTLRWIGLLAHDADHVGVSTALRRSVGTAPSPISDVLERVHADRLVGQVPDDDDPPLPLRDAVRLAHRELDILDRGIEREAVSTAPAAAPVAPPTAGVEQRFRREGAVWTLSYAGATVRVPDAKGLHDLAVLLGRPGREVPATELMGAAVVQGDTGPTLDAAARSQYERRIIELQQELTELEDAHDLGRAATVQAELDLLVDELAAASGLGGRARHAGGTAERARAAVTWRIRSAIKRIAGLHPELGEHLRATVRTGTWCAYLPESPVTWQV